MSKAGFEKGSGVKMVPVGTLYNVPGVLNGETGVTIHPKGTVVITIQPSGVTVEPRGISGVTVHPTGVTVQPTGVTIRPGAMTGLTIRPK